jgi:hypothetical protein
VYAWRSAVKACYQLPNGYFSDTLKLVFTTKASPSRTVEVVVIVM